MTSIIILLSLPFLFQSLKFLKYVCINNYRFTELSSVMEPGRAPKTDKVAIISDAIRMVNQARDEAKRLKDLNSGLLEKIKELKVQKKTRNVSLDLRDVSINPYDVFLICRRRRTSCVMRNRS